MSRARLTFHGRLATTGGGPLAVTYDTRFGTATDASGWVTLGLQAGNRRVWVDSVNGLDANSGLDSAHPKQTWDAAFALYVTGTSGDQLMVAGTGGRIYTDNGTHDWSAFGGASMTYPNAVMSYNPAAPSDSSQYGRLVGSDMPIVNVVSVPSLEVAGATGTNYYFVQGLEINGQGQSGMGCTISAPHDGIGVQNTRWNGIALAFNPTNTDDAQIDQRIMISKSSFWGAWNNSSGNNQGFYDQYSVGLIAQDNVLGHCGWKPGTWRDDTVANGAPTVFGHGNYIHAGRINAKLDRMTYFDNAADGFNLRGSGQATQITSLNEPLTGAVGGFSSSYTEMPTGGVITVDDWVMGGGADINALKPRGNGPNNGNTIAGSYIRNCAMFDNQKRGGGGDAYLGGGNSNPNITQTMLCDKWHGYNYSANIGANNGGAYPSSATWTNCALDVAITGATNIDGGGNSITNGSTFPNYKTVAQIVTAMGFADLNSMYNMMLWRPDLPWSQAIHGIAMPAMGLTPQYATVSPPSIPSDTPRKVYGPMLALNLTLSDYQFLYGTSKTVNIVGATASSTISASGLPAGLIINSALRTASWDGVGDGSGSTIHTGAITFTETLASCINSPHSSAVVNYFVGVTYPEEITNAAWTVSAPITNSSGTISTNGNATSLVAYQPVALVNGKQYTVTFPYTMSSGLRLRINLGGQNYASDVPSGATSANLSASGTATLTFTADKDSLSTTVLTSQAWCQIEADGAVFTGTVGPVSFKRIS